MTAEATRIPALYPDELLENVTGFPTIYHFQSSQQQANGSEKTNPLVVCAPGSMHLARIFYGGHEGSKRSDFLAYHLSNHGFNVLSVSYPLESSPELMPATAPTFRIQDWGHQVATIAKKVIEDRDLSTRSIILIPWSMAGRMIVPFNISAKELGLNVQQIVSFAATPGISSIRNPAPGMACSEAGSKLWGEFNDKQIPIPREIFLREYVGGTPINLTGVQLKYNGQGSFIADEMTHEEDTKVFDIANIPFITALYPTSILDASHALADRATWGFLLTYQLEAMIGKQGLQKVQGTLKWQTLMDFVHSAPDRLFSPVQGSHFFFVGENSARNAARKVVKLINDAKDFQKELSEIIS
ncbi:uncharacterized protein N7483_008479 [Penicillium malachiteum]|uniref:uncharacterized protein n=1 Tax=Penicillium malachiteum TaxID=1324776 RepID=UPI002549BD21|nr:uncharacterized protein N7483_008479 [Penicillium malachiteum]KAJ5720545.1 hypothetical protein N7483_008479 [Penicillium malachiteum]